MATEAADDFWGETGIPCWVKACVLGVDGRHLDTQIAEVPEERGHKCLELGLSHVAAPERVEGKGETARCVGQDAEVAVGSRVRERSVVDHVRSYTSPEGVSAQSIAHCEVECHCSDWNFGIHHDDQRCYYAEST